MSTTAEVETPAAAETAEGNGQPEGEVLTDRDGALFNAADYEGPLRLPRIDGEGVDRIFAKLAGRVALDRSDEADVKLIRELKMGQTVTLMVECKVGPPVPSMTTNKDGDLDVLGLTRTFTVTSIYKPAAEEL